MLLCTILFAWALSVILQLWTLCWAEIVFPILGMFLLASHLETVS